MLDFRKVFLTFAAAALVVGSASAQVPELNSFAVNPFEGSVAIEGTTEVLPIATVTCLLSNGGNCTGGNVGSSLAFTLTSNVPFTNQNQAAPNQAKLDAKANDNCGDLGSVTLSAASTVTVSFTATAIAACSPLTGIFVSGLRVNPSGSPLLSQVTLSLASTSLPITASPTTVNFAFVQKSVGVTVDSKVTSAPAYSTVVGAQTNLSSCSLNAGPPGTKTLYFVTEANVSNGFPGSLKTLGDITNNYAMLPNGNNAATQGTTLAVTFTNLNPGVAYYVPLVVAGTGVTLTAVTDATAATLATAVTTAPAAGNVLEALTVSGGTAIAYYQVTVDTQGSETASIPLTEFVSAVASVTSFSLAPVGVNVSLVSAGTGYPTYATNTTSATNTGSSPNLGLLQACSTTILFPYVVNIAGFDTGIAISNASTLPSNSVFTVTPASGTCTLTFYGTGAPAAPGNTYTTPSIPTAGNTAFLLSSTPGASTQGYSVAVCNFQGAHGYAFVIGAGGSADYLGVILNENGIATGTVEF